MMIPNRGRRTRRTSCRGGSFYVVYLGLVLWGVIGRGSHPTRHNKDAGFFLSTTTMTVSALSITTTVPSSSSPPPPLKSIVSRGIPKAETDVLNLWNTFPQADGRSIKMAILGKPRMK
jgi:hypothetical protein